ncbi:nitroreductase family protein [Heyndrickxia ginsengihumi]|uniref:NADH dehydrogenase n=1 Tax=Heyndrickxia ginsengihumi TaxID=363870 RepID=A0A0A6V9S8_9BACI|nr:nitroreductase family protein [Heyndrickxia ginsengihumi]KHD84321.1 NADH dehydrogenase [Heyndrickxia ginsengihumi]MBE6185180.1 nitroreductase family protein [Bacillus sp. (in: firmicutes)]MCM3023823.1 nitroreductase family protein [Heyndrickxia ginsengihumi]NEY19917.1 nitroreductase family protein [Heyndrickxia ginsengihumi]
MSVRKSDYEIDSVYLERWSPRSFSSKEVKENTLLSLFEAARWAPSAFNFQPWRFIIARTPEDREKFMSFIGEFNQTWCKDVPAFALIISKLTSDSGEFRSHAFDAGAAWGYLSLEATRKGLITHPMTGFDFEKAREVLNIPEDYAINALVAIGYQGDKDALPESLRSREVPSPRRPVAESVFEGAFGESLK